MSQLFSTCTSWPLSPRSVVCRGCEAMTLSVMCIFFILPISTIWSLTYWQNLKSFLVTGPEWKFRLQDVSHSSPNGFQCNLYPTVLHHRLRCKQETRMIIPLVQLTVLKLLVSCYLKEKWTSVLRIESKHCFGVCKVCVCLRTTSAFIHKQKEKTTVFSDCSLYCTGACINWTM